MRIRFLGISIIIILGLLVLFFVTRTFLLTKFLQRAISKTEQSLGVEISYKKAGFTGFKSAYVSGILVLMQSGDTLLTSDSIVVNPRLLPLLVGKKRLKELDVYHTGLFLKDSTLRILRAHNRQQSDTSSAKQTNYAEVLNSIQNKLFTYAPAEILVQNSGMEFSNDSMYSSIRCDNLVYSGNDFSGNFTFDDNKSKSRCGIKGYLSRSKHKISAVVSRSDTSLVHVPYIGPKWNALIGFDTLRLSFSFKAAGTDHLDITGYTSADNLSLQHKRIGPDVVSTKKGDLRFTFHIGDRYAEMDSSSEVTINRFSFSPYFRFEKYNDRKVSVAFIRKEFAAQDLFESLPSGLFSNFEGIVTTGNLAYHMKLNVDLDKPDSIIFESHMENKGLKVVKYGVTDFRMMNGPFVHQVYENDRFVKSILVGPENPDFVSLDEISPYLRYSVLTSEDGDFFYHKGFNQKAFTESITTNLKEKRFARGGSTISMQLVKNVFLSRKKTISRKIEEALIVWMIENLHLVSKDRMYEVYLNIMELGPGVYGIKPASYFYFNKPPGALNLTESIYLSSIIPHPKSFRYTFVSNGVMRDYFAGYFKLLSGIMVRRNQVSPSDTVNLKPVVVLTGEAKKLLSKADTLGRADSLFYTGHGKNFDDVFFNP